jgi:hypothetical protein
MARSMVRTLHTKIVGVTFPNPDGSSRQTILRRCFPNENVDLIPEPTNPKDPYAIAVYRKTGEQIGYLRSELARDDFFRRQGCFYLAAIANLTSDEKGQTLGANLFVARFEAMMDRAEASLEFDRLFQSDRVRDRFRRGRPEEVEIPYEPPKRKRPAKAQAVLIDTRPLCEQRAGPPPKIVRPSKPSELSLTIDWICGGLAQLHRAGMKTDLYAPIMGGLVASAVIVALILLARATYF